MWKVRKNGKEKRGGREMFPRDPISVRIQHAHWHGYWRGRLL